MMRAAEIHARIGTRWPEVLRQLGVPESNLSKKNGPCPGCGGTDRYFFSNKFGHGDYFCRHCSPVVGGKQRSGDGFALLQLVHGWDFATARNRVLEAAGLRGGESSNSYQSTHPLPIASAPATVAKLTARAQRLRSESCRLDDCPDAVEYLQSRNLWPAALQSTLRAHVSVEYFADGQRVGRYPALIAAVRDINHVLVTVHVTFLDAGRKLKVQAPRKLLSPLTGHEGCAVRLAPITGDTLGIGEGLETCLTASAIHGMPVWAALNTTLLAKFTPPAAVKRLVIMADNDVPGLQAAATLMQRLQGQVALEIRTPPMPRKDWNDR